MKLSFFAGHDARTFKWKITKFEEKVAEYARDRPCMSQEFALWGLKGLQVEWYPNGVDNSFPGWSAVKLRIPTMQSRCKVSVKWRVIFGSNLWVLMLSSMFAFASYPWVWEWIDCAASTVSQTNDF